MPDTALANMTASGGVANGDLFYSVTGAADFKVTALQLSTYVTAAVIATASIWTAAQTFTSAAPQLTLGVNATTLGSIKLFGNTSGDATIRPTAAAGVATVITFPAATTTLAGLAVAASWTARQGFAAAVPNITLGQTGGNNAEIGWNGSTSGTVSMKTAAAAGTWSWTLPVDAGTVDFVLRTDGAGVTSWVAQTGGSGTPSAPDTSVQFNNGGAFGGSANLIWVSPALTIGAASSATGQIKLANSASANLTTIQAGNAAAAITYTWPTNVGSAGQQLTDAAGDGVLSWAAAGGASGLTVGTTTITSGTTTRVLFDNAGVLGEYVISGSGNVAMTTSPVFTTPSLGVATATSVNGLTITTSTGTLTIPNGVVLTGPAASGTAMTLGNAETVTGVKTFTAAAPQIILGVNTTTLGSIKMFGSTSGDVTIKAAAVAGTATVFQLPPTNGSNTNVLQTDGNGVTSWVAAGGAGGITVGTTTITSGTTTRIPYNNAGVYAEAIGVTSNGTGLIVTANGALSSGTGPAIAGTGTWITGGTATTTKPYMLIEPTGATSTGWSTAGTGLGVNAASGFAGNYADFQLNGGRIFSVSYSSFVTTLSSDALGAFQFNAGGVLMDMRSNPNAVLLASGTAFGWGIGGVDLTLRRAAAATLQQGAADADLNSTIVAQTFRTQGAAAGGTTNQAGKDFTILVSPGKGTGAGGQLILRTTPAGASGTSINAAATGLTITAPAVNMQPSVVVGNQALATTATDGFIYIPTCAGTPTGVPTAFTGRVALVYDTTNFQFWIYDGAWKQPKTPAGAALVTWQ